MWHEGRDIFSKLGGVRAFIPSRLDRQLHHLVTLRDKTLAERTWLISDHRNFVS